MCRECKNMVHPPLSQFDPSRQPFGGTRCRNCGADLTKRDCFYLSHGKPYCPDCIEDASVDDLVRFCETTWDEWLSEMGIVPVSPEILEGGGEWA